ncbi:hypothetical protein G3I51_24055 [Streptomyces sp. SID9944]|nr:hypothetical protein [Streptomyces sp. SID9944]
MDTVTDQPAPDDLDEHVCKPCASIYYCPAAGEIESDCHGGFDICRGQPERHQTVLPCAPASLHQSHAAHEWEPQPGMTPVHCPGHEQAGTEETDQPGAVLAVRNTRRVRRILAVLHLADRPLTYWHLATATCHGPATIYPALYRLERAGWISRQHQPGQLPVYRITDRGRRQSGLATTKEQR